MDRRGIRRALMVILLAAACSAGGKNITRFYIFDKEHGVLYLHARSVLDGALPTLWLLHEEKEILHKLEPVSPYAREARYVEELAAGSWCILRYESEFMKVPSPCASGEAVRFEVYAGTVTYVGRLDLKVRKEGAEGPGFSLDIVDEGDEAKRWFAAEYPRFIDRYYVAPMQYRGPGERLPEQRPVSAPAPSSPAPGPTTTAPASPPPPTTTAPPAQAAPAPGVPQSGAAPGVPPSH
ncbi:MAG: hypothetical protein AB2A00_40395 [Myxococcota bacterium]